MGQGDGKGCGPGPRRIIGTESERTQFRSKFRIQNVDRSIFEGFP
jgi:hypothetical protein